jgi:hypothetical protein
MQSSPTVGRTYLASALFASALATSAAAQSYQDNTAQIPPSGSATENVDFADIDGDGDRDLIWANGGDGGNDQSVLWVNRGFEAGGTIGWFANRTATQFPNIQADSRDADFDDIDGDGDFDIYISNTAQIVNQSNRWWINMGGAQGGTPGFFVDQTQAHWTFIGVNDGVNHFSSIAPTTALASGGFIDWSCDCVFGDLDSDGDLDLVHTTYGGSLAGGVPSRIFLNNGTGFFEEFNPSHFQLAAAGINSGNPGLWCEGTYQDGTSNTSGVNCDIADTPLGVEIGDFDGDFDVDILQGARNEIPRVFINRMSDTGSFTKFRDVTYLAGTPAAATGGGNYEQDMADFDNDGDLDIYGLNWPGFDDCTLKNNGSGVFGSMFTLPGSGSDDNEGDFVDYNNDGKLDIYVGNFSGQDRLYKNLGAPAWSFSNVTSTEMPNDSTTTLGEDSCDVDNDGDYDMMIANDGGQQEQFYLNLNQIADTTAPSISHLEQVPDRTPGPAPTAIRAHVYDNSSWDVARYDQVTLEYSTDGINWNPSTMAFAGGQMFRGSIAGNINGTIQYRVRAIDEHGNVGLSTTKSYLVSGCLGNVVTYCTAGVTTNFCLSAISATGVPSVSAGSGFTINVTNTEGQRQGLIFYGVNGRMGIPWAVRATCASPTPDSARRSRVRAARATRAAERSRSTSTPTSRPTRTRSARPTRSARFSTRRAGSAIRLPRSRPT